MKTVKSNLHARCLYRRTDLRWALVLFILLGACSGDGDYRKVDFGPKIDVAQPVAREGDRPRMQVAVAAMISPQETLIYYREFIDYLFTRLGYDAELVQRKTYGEVNTLLAEGAIDLALICTGPYVTAGERPGFEAIATPVIRGQPTYQSYLLVHRDSAANSLADLKGKDFAFTDPESNTGAFVPRYWLALMGATPESFFRSFTYTYSHDNSIMAVAKGLVDGAAVDGHIWDYYQRHNAFYTSQTRVIQTSEPFGSPPVVVSHRMDPELKSTLAQLILTMHEEPEGQRILSELMIDRFAVPEERWYTPVMNMLIQLGAVRDSGDGD